MVSKSYDLMGRMLHFAGPKFSAYIVEFIGTFFLVLTIGLNTRNTTGTAPLAIGSILMVMIFMGGHISGAHYNPAVTFGVRLTGRDHITNLTAFIYVIVQVLGGLVAALVVYGVTDDLVTFGPAPGTGVRTARAFVVEFLYTFALVSVMLNFATTKSQNSNSFFGLAIGFTVAAGAWSVGPISGAAFNPAVATGPLLVESTLGHGENIRYIWIYWLGPLMGSCLAAIVFRVTNTSEYRKGAAIAAKTPNPIPTYSPIQEGEEEV